MNKRNSKLSLTDRFLEILGVAGVALLFLLPVLYINKLPGSIPVHFDLLGNPDRYGNRNSIWALPAIGFFLFMTIVFIPKMLIRFNNSTEYGEEKKSRYRNATRLLRIVNVLVVFMFCSITYYTILISLGETVGLLKYSALFFLLLITVVIVFFVVKIKRAQK